MFAKNKIIRVISLFALAFLFFSCCGGEEDAVLYRGSSGYVVRVEDSEGVPLGGIYCTLRNDKISQEPLAYGETEPYPLEEYHGDSGEMWFGVGNGNWKSTNVYVISDKPSYELTHEEFEILEAVDALCDLESGTPTDYYIVINDSSTGKQNDAYETDRIVYFSDFESRDYSRTKITLETGNVK